MENFKEEVITLLDENGKEILFAFVDTIIYDDKEYAVLKPLNQLDGEVVDEYEEDGIIMEMIVEENGDIIFNNLEDENLFEILCNIYWEE